MQTHVQSTEHTEQSYYGTQYHPAVHESDEELIA